MWIGADTGPAAQSAAGQPGRYGLDTFTFFGHVTPDTAVLAMLPGPAQRWHQAEPIRGRRRQPGGGGLAGRGRQRVPAVRSRRGDAAVLVGGLPGHRAFRRQGLLPRCRDARLLPGPSGPAPAGPAEDAAPVHPRAGGLALPGVADRGQPARLLRLAVRDGR